MRAESGKVNWNQSREELVLIRSMHLPVVNRTIERFDIELQFRLATWVTLW